VEVTDERLWLRLFNTVSPIAWGVTLIVPSKKYALFWRRRIYTRAFEAAQRLELPRPGIAWLSRHFPGDDAG